MIEFEIFNRFLKDLNDLEQLDDFGKRQREQLSSQARTAAVKRRKRLNPLLELPEQEFRTKYRFSKENMQRIVDMVRDDLEIESNEQRRKNQVPVELQIMCAIRLWGSSEHPEMTAMAHGVTTKTMAKICKRVSAALASKSSRYIRMPATLAEKERVTNAFKTLANMPQVIGTLTNFHVRMSRQYSRINKKLCNGSRKSTKAIEHEDGFLQIQIISDAANKIRDLNSRFLKSRTIHSAEEMFAQTKIKERLEQNEFRGRILLADGLFESFSCLFTPVLCPTSSEERAYNTSHKITLGAVHNCVKLWKKRFDILNYEMRASYTVGRHTILALALLHNMAIEWGDPTLDNMSNGYTKHAETNGESQKTPETNARLEYIRNYF